jgi:hypothetical protein
MNQEYFIFNITRPLRPWREQSLSQSRIKNPESKITSSSNPLLLALTLSLLSSFTSFAWDDDDDTGSKPFHRSNYNQQSSANDYGYKNNYQASSANDYGYKNPYQSKIQHQESRITPTSTIDFGGPKRLAQADDDNDSKPFHQSTRERVPQPRGNIQNSANDYDYDAPKKLDSLHVSTIEESVALRDRESREMMAESQRSFERQEAQQEKSRAQMAKQQEIYNKMDREEGEMAEFLGGVYKAKFGATTGHNSAITSDGYVFRSGNNFVTPKGIYTKTGNTYAGPGSFTTQTGTLFFGNESTTIQAGGAYFSEGKSGFIVAPNTRNTSTWRTR